MLFHVAPTFLKNCKFLIYIFSKVEKNALHLKMKCIDCYCSFFSLKEDVNTVILIAVVTDC